MKRKWPTWLTTVLSSFLDRLHFIRALLQLAVHPRATAREIVNRRWPARCGPKAFASIALGFFLATSAVIEHTHPRWLDSYNVLSPQDQAFFRHTFGLAPSEIDQEGEAFSPGSTRAANIVASQMGEAPSNRAIATYLEVRDQGFAQRFRDAADYADSTTAILLRWGLGVAILPMLTAAFLVVYWICARRRLSLTTALNLSAYFNGYYLVVFALIKLLRLRTLLGGDSANADLERLLGDTAASLIDLAVICLLMVQFYKYCGQAFRCTKLRLTGGVLAAVCTTGVGVVLAVVLLLAVLSIPLIDRQIHNLG
jgi:hypothetical protein